MHNSDLTRRTFVGAVAAAGLMAADQPWVELFNRRNLDGWRPSENKASWKVVNGELVADGPRSHLFYTGPVRGASFRNFELEVEALTRPGCNSGVFFHTAYQEAGFPLKGFEVKRTGSLYGLRNIYKQLVPDDQWFKIHIAVRGKNIQVRLNGTLLVDYTEPVPPVGAEGDQRQRVLGRGTFALGCHDDGSKARFRSVHVRPLPDDVPTPGPAPVVDDVFRQIVAMGTRNIPMVDYHAHLKGGLTLEQVLAQSRKDGIQYGLAVNCGKGFPTENDDAVRAYVDSLKGQPVFIAMQGEGREWTQMFSRRAVALFDYTFTDSMTWTDNHGRRLRLWISEEVGSIADAQEFMDTLVERAVGILEREPIDIYANPTFLPDLIAKDYDRLWTEKRMRQVISAAARNGVAIELNDRYRLPSPAFVRMAKEAGCKFSFGTNNTGPEDLGRCEYGLRMVNECKLGWQDFFVPGAWGPKAVERKGGALRS